MSIEEAVKLIENMPLAKAPQKWCDLGAGSGTFAKALARLLPTQSSILAVDKNSSSLQQIPDTFEDVNIEKKAANFVKTELPSPLDGILMANAIHYVRKKEAFLLRIIPKLHPEAGFLIIEYDTSRMNPWIPFPLNYQKMEALFTKVGFSEIQRLGVKPSIYGNGLIYAAFCKRPA